MPEDKNFFKNVNDINVLNKFLKEHFDKHAEFKLYLKDEASTKRTLNNGLSFVFNADWNDLVDKKNCFENVNFIRCLTYSKSENIAMWLIYALNGYLLRMTKGIISNLCAQYSKQTTRPITAPLKILKKGANNENEETGIELGKEDYEFVYQDVVYFGEDEKKNYYAVKKSIYWYEIEKGKLKGLSQNIFAKTYGWSFENECRMVFKVKNPKAGLIRKLNCPCLIEIPFESKKNISIFRSPIKKSGETSSELQICGIEVKDSTYSGTINYSPTK